MQPGAVTNTTAKTNDAPVIAAGQALPRMISLDVFRGFVMFLMMAEVLYFSRVSDALPGNGFWSFLAFHQDHVPWAGCSLHDLIQPSFSFLVGVALPFSLANRLARGASKGSLFRHALVRSLILVLLGIFLRSMHSEQTNFTFEDTLTQIGLGYPFLFLLGLVSQRVQVISLVVILAGYWLAFVLYPLPDAGFDYKAAGVAADWQHNFTGLSAHWNKNTNLAWAFDRWFLNLFPREKPFLRNGGGYATLSFIPTLGTMILGLIAGNTIKEKISPYIKLRRYMIIGGALIVLGLLLHISGINPIVKRIWTPAWTIFSGGYCFLLLGAFYGVIDVKNYRKWSFPLMVIGMNSIAAYVIAHVLPDFIHNTFAIHIGKEYDKIFGAPYATLVSGFLILLVEYFILRWMFRKKIFIKI
jgi:predicted acyltransferase